MVLDPERLDVWQKTSQPLSAGGVKREGRRRLYLLHPRRGLSGSIRAGGLLPSSEKSWREVRERETNASSEPTKVRPNPLTSLQFATHHQLPKRCSNPTTLPSPSPCHPHLPPLRVRRATRSKMATPFSPAELSSSLAEIASWGLSSYEILPEAFCKPSEARASLALLEPGDTALVAVSPAGWKVCLRSVVDYGVGPCSFSLLSSRLVLGANGVIGARCRGCQRTARRRTTRCLRPSTT